MDQNLIEVIESIAKSHDDVAEAMDGFYPTTQELLEDTSDLGEEDLHGWVPLNF